MTLSTKKFPQDVIHKKNVEISQITDNDVCRICIEEVRCSAIVLGLSSSMFVAAGGRLIGWTSNISHLFTFYKIWGFQGNQKALLKTVLQKFTFVTIQKHWFWVHLFLSSSKIILKGRIKQSDINKWESMAKQRYGTLSYDFLQLMSENRQTFSLFHSLFPVINSFSELMIKIIKRWVVECGGTGRCPPQVRYDDVLVLLPAVWKYMCVFI